MLLLLVIFGVIAAASLAVSFPEGTEVRHSLLPPLSPTRHRPHLDSYPLGPVVLCVTLPLEFALWLRRRALARGWAPWLAAAVLVPICAGSAAVLAGPVRARLIERLVAEAVAGRRELIRPGELADFEAWAGGIAGAYIDKALVCFTAMVLVVRVIAAVALRWQARVDADRRRRDSAWP
ncbi:hypothetical protein [Cellulomonas denverensis]|uniref:Uncharacterized protein n=1 Tax=Cellulomonas denverensis TaxID=264297 RepID=A0A7X6KTB4_9CELL|nr:hypothetical protein [Cellulomonas denverensis]NKY21753.1 hypothetical protein [Cellulomonas denverensis]